MDKSIEKDFFTLFEAWLLHQKTYQLNSSPFFGQIWIGLKLKIQFFKFVFFLLRCSIDNHISDHVYFKLILRVIRMLVVHNGALVLYLKLNLVDLTIFVQDHRALVQV